MAVGAHTVVYIQYCIETEAAPKGSKMQNRTKNSHTGACKCGKILIKSRLFVLGASSIRHCHPPITLLSAKMVVVLEEEVDDEVEDKDKWTRKSFIS